MMFALSIIVIDYIFLLFAATRDNFNKLQSFVVSKLVYMSIFAPVLLSIFGVVTNVGTVVYGSVMVAQCLLMYRFGKDIALRVLYACLFVLFMVVMLGLAISLLPVFPGNENYILASQQLLSFSPQNIFGSFFAFVISQNLLIRVFYFIKSRSLVARTFLSVSLAQVIDSLIFFPIAFFDVPGWYMIMLSGFVVKIALLVVFLPIAYLIEKRYEV